MLVLSRKTGQSIIIGDEIEISVVEIKGEQVKIAVKAPRDVPVYRREIYEQIREENRQAACLPAGVKPEELLNMLPVKKKEGPETENGG